jgi:hypothetical protein
MPTVQLAKLFYLVFGDKIAAARIVHSCSDSGPLFVRQPV